MTEHTHTELPWTLQSGTFITDQYGDLVSKIDGDFILGIDEANAEFIMRTCNNHYNLRAALSELASWCRGYEKDINNPMAVKYIEAAEAALAKADLQS